LLVVVTNLHTRLRTVPMRLFSVLAFVLVTLTAIVGRVFG
jgi:hypothetical protein